MSKNKIKKLHPVIQCREQYYIKRGKRYYPVNDPGAYDGLSEGSWMVIVDKGCKSIRTIINPKYVELDAALKHLEDELCRSMMEISKMRPSSTPISEKEQKAWKVFEEMLGKDMPKQFQYASYWEIANKGCEHIKKIMLENKMDLSKIQKKYGVRKNKAFNQNPILGLEI